uniref:Galactose-1-phosphate uridylyltransferase n=1 Tax=Timema monikensis TaxID=170555 RepID=A0A7R9E3J7_9NEOP|nr:unnamed protein product [Timema monikensis]
MEFNRNVHLATGTNTGGPTKISLTFPTNHNTEPHSLTVSNQFQVTPVYKSTCTFNNDFPALLKDVPSPPKSEDPLFQMGPAQGECRVICFHPKSNITLPLMTIDEIRAIIDRWVEETNSLGIKYLWVQIFENRGEIMGCSNPHPHCQIWASSFFPNEPRIKDFHQKEYFKKHGRPLLMDYVAKELEKKERIVIQNSDWLVVVPFWAMWPYETMVLPKTHLQRFTDLSKSQKTSLAEIIKLLGIKYDNLFKISFPYSMGWHGTSSRRVFRGYELLAQGQRDLTQEQAAEKLRELPEFHYKLVAKEN